MLLIPPSVEGGSPTDRADSMRIVYVDSAMDPGNRPIPRVASVKLLLLDSAEEAGFIFGLNWAAETASCAQCKDNASYGNNEDPKPKQEIVLLST